jgi:two-component system OmpR family response regulator
MDDISPILVVDDEMLVRLALVEALEEGGYSVIEAANGDAALKQIERSEQLRGLVTDIRMPPGKNGWEVAHSARQKFPSLAVVYVTADSLDQWSSNGVPLSTVLQKPFAHAELITALSNLLVANPPPSSPG